MLIMSSFFCFTRNDLRCHLGMKGKEQRTKRVCYVMVQEVRVLRSKRLLSKALLNHKTTPKTTDRVFTYDVQIQCIPTLQKTYNNYI